MYFNSRPEKWAATFGLVLVTSATCWGQVSANRKDSAPASKKETRSLTELERRGLENLDRIALESRQLDNSAIRTELQSLIGDALWDFDKVHARNIFRDAFKNARAIQDPRRATVAQTQVVKRVWTRDRTLAEELMKQLADSKTDTKTDPKGDFGVANQFGMKASPVNQQKLELARELLDVDTGGAAELIGTSLQHDMSFPGINLLAQLRTRDPAAADVIFQRAIQQLPKMPDTSGIMAAIAMGDYLAPSCALCSPSTNPPSASIYYNAALAVLRRSLGQTIAPPPIKSDLQDRLAQYFHEMQATLAVSLSRFAGPADLPELEAIYQQQVQTLEPLKRTKLEALKSMQRSPDKFEELRQNAETIPDMDQRDQAILTLVEGALRQNPGNERMSKLAELVDKMQSGDVRDRALALLQQFEINKLIRASRFDEAFALGSKLPNASIRGQALRELSLAVTRTGSLTVSDKDVLSAALEALDKADSSIEKARLLFRITSDFVNLRDYEKAFGALQYSTASLGSLKRDEFEDANTAPSPNSVFDYHNSFGRLGNVDFDRTMFLAQNIKWREFRLAAEIATCQSVLSKKP